MPKKYIKKNKNKQSTDDLIANAIDQQNSWRENRRTFARKFLKTLNIFARPAPTTENIAVGATDTNRKHRSGIMAYWFPIMCAIVVIIVAIWVVIVRNMAGPNVVVLQPAVEQNVVAKPIKKQVTTPSFDIVRIEKGGMIVIAGRWMPNQNVSIVVNGKIVATERTDNSGEFVYAPRNAWDAGNYTISLLGTDPDVKSENKVFVYVSPYDYKNSVSLLMTRDGSTLLQAPTMLRDGDLNVSKIDYLAGGRIVVTGDALPRLRVSLALNDKYMGFARVSDHKHFGLGADVGELVPGKDYKLTVRLHDGDGRTLSTITHEFVMPEMTGDDDTFYTVRRGDCLWIIARNFLRRGILFSLIAERNNITNSDLIFPKQELQIPVKE
ncbi:MAG: LysM peptidoglycan-binding domain-containing protein [Alphaproteobacteria bacterium]|nr:LysM peptidoglycan-binding domain-containing protein [Alphaproteobacteria bacterium]